jgi:hypothetical protein
MSAQNCYGAHEKTEYLDASLSDTGGSFLFSWAECSGFSQEEGRLQPEECSAKIRRYIRYINAVFTLAAGFALEVG